jgi:hypothetical protein
MKTAWDRRVAMASTTNAKDVKHSLCTISDEAFALLLLENSYDRWLDIFCNNKGAVMQRRGVKQRAFQSDTPTLYTKGGIKYDKTDMRQSVKGWSDEGIARFNVLFEQVKRDRETTPLFERRWLAERNKARGEVGANLKKRKRQPTQARSELFESDNEEDIAPAVDEGPVEESDDGE